MMRIYIVSRYNTGIGSPIIGAYISYEKAVAVMDRITNCYYISTELDESGLK